MSNINFPGGSGTSIWNGFIQSGYIQQTGVTRPAANPALDGSYPIYIDQINISGAAGSYSLRLRSGGTNYTVGSVFPGSASSSTVAIRMYHNSGTVDFDRTEDSGVADSDCVRQYTDADALAYTWNGQLRGNWDYFLVPVAPTSITATRTGRTVAVTYTAGSNGGSSVTSTTIQRRVSGDTVWSTHSSSDSLAGGQTYEFRVYQTNVTGNGAAATTSLFVPSYGYKYNSTTSSFSDPVNTVKVFIGIGEVGADAAGWKTVTSVKRYVSNSDGLGNPGWIDLVT